VTRDPSGNTTAVAPNNSTRIELITLNPSTGPPVQLAAPRRLHPPPCRPHPTDQQPHLRTPTRSKLSSPPGTQTPPVRTR
jgi:hypothetical protein